MRFNTNNHKNSELEFENGFTIVELMVVVSLFVVITGLILANYAGLRPARNLKIAQNELVSNLRKVASYTLSSRALNGNKAVQYYLLKFDFATPDRYFVEAIYDVTSAPKLAQNVETIRLPAGVKFYSASPFYIDRPPVEYPSLPSGSEDVLTNNGNLSPCVLVAFKLPFAKIIMNGGNDPLNSQNTGCRFNNFSSDDYEKIKNFVANSFSNTVSSDSVLTLTLMDSSQTLFRTVTINGITGGIVFSQ